MADIEFPNHSGMRIRYSLSVSTDGRTTTYVAAGDTRQKYTAYVQQSPDGWEAHEVSDTGSGAVIADRLATKWDAVRWAQLFVACSGGKATITD